MDGLEGQDLATLLNEQEPAGSLEQLWQPWTSSNNEQQQDLEQLWQTWTSSSNEQQQDHPDEAGSSSCYWDELQQVCGVQPPCAGVAPHAAFTSASSHPGGAAAGYAPDASHPTSDPHAMAAVTSGVTIHPVLPVGCSPVQPLQISQPLAMVWAPGQQQQQQVVSMPCTVPQQLYPGVDHQQQFLHPVDGSSYHHQQQQQLEVTHEQQQQLFMGWPCDPAAATGTGWVAPGFAAAAAVTGGAAAAGGGGGGAVVAAAGYPAVDLVTMPSDASSNTMLAVGGWLGLAGVTEQPASASSLHPTAASGAAAGGLYGVSPFEQPALQYEFNDLRLQLCAVADTSLSRDMRAQLNTQTARFVVRLSAAADAAGLFHTAGDGVAAQPIPGRRLEHFEQLAAAGLLDGSLVGYWAYKHGHHPGLSSSAMPAAAAATTSTSAAATCTHGTWMASGSSSGSSSSSSGSAGSGGGSSSYAIVVSSTRCNPRGTTSAECHTRRRDFSRHTNTLPALNLAVRITGPDIPTALDGSPAWFLLYGLSAIEDMKTVKLEGSSWRHSVTAPAVQVQEGTQLPIPLPAATTTVAADGSIRLLTSTGKTLEGAASGAALGGV